MKNICVFCLIILTGFNLSAQIKKEQTLKQWYEKIKFIMTREEKKEYKLLQDEAEQEEFLKKFWKKRDPNSATEENEFKVEFERRIEYVNTWFWFTKTSKAKGWLTDRGRLYLILGHPDRIIWKNNLYTNEIWEGERTRDSKKWNFELWYYIGHRLLLVFRKKGYNDYALMSTSPQLMTAIDRAILSYVESEGGTEQKIVQKFTVKIKERKIFAELPIENIVFEELENKMISKFNVKVYIYLKNELIHSINEVKIMKGDKEELLNKDNILVEIPLKIELRGKYTFKISIRDQFSRAIFKKIIKSKL